MLPDICKWWYSEATEALEDECGPNVSAEAGTDESVAGTDGPVLEAWSGICLIITAYSRKSKCGVLIHLGREETLNDTARDLILLPLKRYKKDLKKEVFVHTFSSRKALKGNEKQLEKAKELVLSVIPGATVIDVTVVDNPKPKTVIDGPVDLNVYLNTEEGTLDVEDRIGGTEFIEYADL